MLRSMTFFIRSSSLIRATTIPARDVPRRLLRAVSIQRCAMYFQDVSCSDGYTHRATARNDKVRTLWHLQISLARAWSSSAVKSDLVHSRIAAVSAFQRLQVISARMVVSSPTSPGPCDACHASSFWSQKSASVGNKKKKKKVDRHRAATAYHCTYSVF